MRIELPASAALLALVMALPACGGGKEAAAMSRERFVAANVALRTVPDTAAAADSLRTAVLEEHRVTEDDLNRFVTAHADEPGYLAQVWREISNQVDSVWEKNWPREQAAPGGESPDQGGHRVIVGADQGPIPPPPPVTRPGEPITIRETPKPQPPPPGDRTPPDPQLRRPPEGPPPDARTPWVPGPAARDSLRLPVPPEP